MPEFYILICRLKNQTMKKITFSLLSFFAVLTITAIQSCKPSSKASTATLLKFNLEKGKGYDYEMVWDLDSKAMGQTTKLTIDGLYSMKITDDDGKIKTVATSYKSLKMNMNVMGMEIELDSYKPLTGSGETGMEKNPIGMMSKVFSGIVNKPFSMRVDEEGRVLELTGFDKIITDMIDSLGLDAQMKTQVLASMKDQFNEQTMKDNMAQLFTIFPNKEIKVGDSWDKSYTTGGKMAGKFTTTYTVKEIEGDHVTMSTKTKIGPIDNTTEIDGTQTGNIIVDSKTGLMINAEYNQDIKVTTQGVTVDIVGKGKIRGKAIN